MTEPEDAAPAATIVLLRERPNGQVEIFMVERADTMGFAAGMMVFPGGKVDAEDHLLAADEALAPGHRALDPVDAAARIAAIRETFEEAGVLLTDGPALADAERAELRERVAGGGLAFSAMLREIGHRIDADLLVPYARWVPPIEVTHRRFDTHFYLARMPQDSDAVHDGSENTRSHWITAQEALDLADRGKGALIFPTRRNLERLALHVSVDALIADARAVAPPYVLPWFAEREDGLHLCIEPGLGYPVTTEPFRGKLRAGVSNSRSPAPPADPLPPGRG